VGCILRTFEKAHFKLDTLDEMTHHMAIKGIPISKEIDIYKWRAVVILPFVYIWDNIQDNTQLHLAACEIMSTEHGTICKWVIVYRILATKQHLIFYFFNQESLLRKVKMLMRIPLNPTYAT